MNTLFNDLLFKFVANVTGNNAVISPNFLVWKFCGNAQFPGSLGRFARNYTEAVSFYKISTPGNYGELRYFLVNFLFKAQLSTPIVVKLIM